MEIRKDLAVIMTAPIKGTEVREEYLRVLEYSFNTVHPENDPEGKGWEQAKHTRLLLEVTELEF